MRHPGTQRWVMWLPMVAVTLPTVCLLWFMTAAVRNERLAIKQKLIEAYGRTLTDVQQDNQRRWRQGLEWTGKDWPSEPAALFKGVVTGVGAAKGAVSIQGAIVCDASGRIVYPILPAAPEGRPSDQPQPFQRAWEAEYMTGDFAEAAAQYEQVSRFAAAPEIQVAASIAAVRCLAKAGRTDQAVGFAREALQRQGPDLAVDVAVSLFNLRIQVVQICRDSNLPALAREAADLLDKAVDYSPSSPALPSEARAFVLGKASDLLPADLVRGSLARQVEMAGQLRDAEVLSTDVAQHLDPADRPGDWPEKVVRRLRLAQPVYGFHMASRDRRLLFLMDKDHLAACLKALVRQTVPASLGFRVTDDKGTAVCESEATDSPLA
jgi:hypothetical protein